jgi:multidrug efflux pump subunit AcrB
MKHRLFTVPLTKPNSAARLANFFVRNYRITILLMVLMVVSGLYALFALPREGFPQISVPFGMVVTAYPGATAADVEEHITKPLEQEIAKLDNVKTLSSQSRHSVSHVSVQFDARSDLEGNIQRLREVVASASSRLPGEAEKPEVIDGVASGSFELLLNVVGPYSPLELGQFAQTIQDDIESISGVTKATLSGHAEREIHVTLHRDGMLERGITVAQIQQAIQGSNIRFPGGAIETDSRTLQLSVLGQFESLDQLRELAVGAGQGGIVRLDDIADIADAHEDIQISPRTGFRQDGEFVINNSVTLSVSKSSQGDIVDITRAVEDIIADAKDDRDALPENVEPVIIYTTANDVTRDINDLSTSALVGLVLILIVLMVFISARTSIIVATVIPLVFLVTFAVLLSIGFTFNVLTLFALILTSGILVDNAIVIAEAIQLHLELGQKRREAITRAVHEVGLPVVTSAVTTVLVFIPMAFIGGITGEFIKYIPYTVIIALISSLVIALTIIPFLGYRFMRVSKRNSRTNELHTWKIVRRYGDYLHAVLKSRRNRWMTFGASFVLFVASVALVVTGLIQVNIWPPLDDAEYMTVSVGYPPSTRPQDQDRIRAEVEQRISRLSEVTSFAPMAFGGGSDTTVFINLTSADERDAKASDLQDRLRESFEEIDTVLPTGEATIKVDDINVGPPQSEFPIELQVSGDNLDALKQAANDISAYVHELEGIDRAIDSVSTEETPQVQIKLRRDELERRDISAIAVAETVRSVYQPLSAGSYVETGTDSSVAISLRFDRDIRDSVDDIRDLRVSGATGSVRLADIADIDEVRELQAINRYDQKRFVEVRASVLDSSDPRTIDTVKRSIEEEFSADKLESYGLRADALTFRGAFEEEEEAFNSLGLTFVIAILLIYIVLVAQFNSFVQPGIILFSVPLALIGVFPALALTGNFFSFFAMIGIIALAGVVVNDAIVFISTINSLRKEEHLAIEEAIVEAAKLRFKPILSTTITSIGGILPLTITVAVWESLGVSFIFGLLVGTLATLTVIPVIYYSLTVTGMRFAKKKSNHD